MPTPTTTTTTSGTHPALILVRATELHALYPRYVARSKLRVTMSMLSVSRSLTRRHWFFVAIDRNIVRLSGFGSNGGLRRFFFFRLDVEPVVLGLVQADGPGNVIDLKGPRQTLMKITKRK